VVQLQGCPIQCHGCYVPETHDPTGGTLITVDEVVRELLDPISEPRDGVTVTGGEAFSQPAGLAALLKELKARDLHTVVYTGYTLGMLARRSEPDIHEAFHLIDLLVDGPFVATLTDGAGEWRGSSNQRLIPHPLGVSRLHVNRLSRAKT
jgi:anaerobic ribonucleoside-triphosphate reductase activating protein